VNPPRVVVMGVSGCGKSTVGALLARRLQVPFVEGDAWHPPRNVERMSAGIPLTDEDRRVWLEALAGRVQEAVARQEGLVLACSALKRAYRDLLRGADPGLRFVWLHGREGLLAARMHGREGHYMPPSLLRSQLDTLEPPSAGEHAIALDVDASPEALTTAALRHLAPAPART
jgi:gluconokinase